MVENHESQQDQTIPDPRDWAEDDDVRVLLLEGSDVDLDSFIRVVREPADLAELLRFIAEAERRRYVFSRFSEELAAEVLAELDEEEREPLMADMPSTELAKLVGDMETDDAADVLGELPPERAEEVLGKFDDAEDRDDVRRLMDYAEDSAGGLMQTELVAVAATSNVADAIEEVRKHVEEDEDVNVLYVIDSQKKPVGQVPLVQLVLRQPTAVVSDIMEDDPLCIQVDEDQEEVARLFQKYDLFTTPVVDMDGCLIGQITVDDVVDVMEEEASEDILNLVGAAEEDLVYTGSILKISGSRLAWLVTNLFGGIVAAWLISLFTETLIEVIALAAFIPVITAMGGNVGIQSSTITIRGFATGKLRSDNLKMIFLKELGIGAFMGLVCGFTVASFALLWQGNPYLGLVVGLAMFFAVTVASSMGALLPAGFRAIGVDPAIAAGPFVTTANDITGILIYFLTATSFLPHLK